MKMTFPGSHAADLMGIDHDQMYKTLVLKGEKKGYLVCCIPVDEELDLKKVAKAAGEKKVEMIHVKDMLGITGYIRGGCSPIGMKKKFPTYIEETAQLYDTIMVSAGQRGVQVTVSPEDLPGVCGWNLCGISVGDGHGRLKTFSSDIGTLMQACK